MSDKLENQFLDHDDGPEGLHQSIINSETMAEASIRLKDHLLTKGMHLLSVKFCDNTDDGEIIRPFSAYTSGVIEVGKQLQAYGGCPFAKESKKRLVAFDSCSVDRSQYSSFLERRFFMEIDRTAHKHIAVVPVLIGRAIGLFTIGLGEKPLRGELKQTVVDMMVQVVPAFIKRFPEIATLFERKHLSHLERDVISMKCAGFEMQAIENEVGLSEQTIILLVENACRKLEVSNDHQLIYKALALGEISTTVENIPVGAY